MIYKFGELFRWSSGKPTLTDEGNVPIYGSNGIIGYCSSAKYKNRIILGRVGAYCGSVAYCETDFAATDNTLITACDESKILYRYAYYLLKEYKLNDYAGGAAQPLITQGLLKHLKCDIPNIKTQKRIASILSTYDELIENNNRRIRILEQMAENLYKEWFVRFRFPGHSRGETKQVKPKGWVLSSNSAYIECPKSWGFNEFIKIGKFVRGKNITADNMITGEIPVISAGIEPSGYHNACNVNGQSITISASGANAGYLKYHQISIWAAD